MHLYPNPARNEVFLHFETDHPNTFYLTLYNVSGLKVGKTKEIIGEKGNQEYRLSLDDFEPGVYTASVEVYLPSYFLARQKLIIIK